MTSKLNHFFSKVHIQKLTGNKHITRKAKQLRETAVSHKNAYSKGIRCGRIEFNPPNGTRFYETTILASSESKISRNGHPNEAFKGALIYAVINIVPMAFCALVCYSVSICLLF